MNSSEIAKLKEENRKLKKQVEELSHHKDKYQKLFDVSADALSILDLDTGKFIECNQSAIEMHGVESEENFLNLAPSQISPEFQPCGRSSEVMAIERITKTFTDGPQVFQWQHSRLDGSTFPCLVSLTALPTTRRKLVLAIGRDISEIIGIQNKLANANDAKSIFLANMSHELRTPMTTVLGYVDLILEDPKLRSTTRESCGKIKYATSSLLSILNEILDMSKLETGKLELEYIDFDFSLFMKQIVTMFEHNRAGDDEVKWTLSIDKNIPQGIHSDPTRLKQVLINLIGNAKKFTKKGSISIICKVKVDSNKEPLLEVSIIDSGIGINDSIKDKIFDPFSQADSTTSRKFSGTGLGLPISKKIIELMGGHINATGVTGEGSTFWFTVPLIKATGELSNLQPSPINGRYRATRSLNILFAEDNRINQVLAKKVISGYDHNIDCVENGKLAIEALLANEYDVVLMDVRMPEMDGIEATKEIRKLSGKNANIPIIAVTADAMKDNLGSYLAAGMNACCSKPFDWPKLLLTINQVLGENIHLLDKHTKT